MPAASLAAAAAAFAICAGCVGLRLPDLDFFTAGKGAEGMMPPGTAAAAAR